MSKKHAALLALEKKFWTGNPAFYAEHTDKECRVAFAEMAGIMDNAAIAATAREQSQWKGVAIELKGVIEPSDDVTLISYEAMATRQNGEPYKALASTGYKKHRDGWKMMFHTQVPLDEAA